MSIGNNNFSANGNGTNGHSNGSYNGLHYNGHGPGVEEDEIDLKELFYRLWHQKWLIIGSVFACGVLALLIALFSTPIYQSNGSLMISQSKGQMGGLGESELGGLLSSTYGIGMGSSIQNELLILQSRNLTRQLADTLFDVRTTPDGKLFPVLKPVYPDSNDIASLRVVAKRLDEKLQFSQVNREADMVKVSYESPSAYEAAFIVNNTMGIYRQFSMRENRKAATAAVQFLKKEKQRIAQNLKQAEDRLRQFMNQKGLVQVDAQTQVMIEQTAELEAKKQELKAKLVAAEAVISETKERLNTIKPGIATQFTSGFSVKMKRLQHVLAEASIQKNILLSNYPNIEKREDKPPKLKKLNQKIDLYKKQIEQLTDKMLQKSEEYAGFVAGANIGETVSELNKKLIMAMVQKQQYSAQIQTINTQLEKNNNFFQNLPDNMITLARLKRDVKINEELFITVSEQYAQMSLWQQTQFGQGRIIDRALITQNPVKPKTILYVLVGLILGGIFSVGYVFVRDAFNNTIDSVERLESLNVPMLSTVPNINKYFKENGVTQKNIEINGRDVSSALVSAYDTNSPVAESFRRIESNIIHSNPDRDLHTLMVTSSTKGEGKTTTIANLATVMAETGKKVMVVETDLRRPNLHNLFDNSISPGIMNVLFDDVPIEQAIKDTFMPGLKIVPAGYIPPNPGAVIKSKAFLSFIDRLKEHYDYLLLDTPPFGIITDASALIKKSDGIAVVCRFNKTTEPELAHTIENLHGIRANVLGTIMTYFDHTKSRDYSYNYGRYEKAYEDYQQYEKSIT